MKNNNFNPEKPISLWQKCVGYLNIALLVGQLGLPTLAQAFTLFDAQQAAAELNADPAFTKVSNSDSQFVKSDYVVESSQARSAQTIETFHAKLVEHNKSGLNPPKYIPIANDSITVIFPHYELTKRVGDRFVQSRMVRTQIYNQLNRTLINGSYTNETQQINDLYNNAFEFAGSTATKFGDKVTENNLKSFNKNFIWPELQTINGEKVLVPVVHLTQSTVDNQRVDGHVTEFGGSRAEFRSITINSGTLKTQRDTFVKTAKDLTVMPKAEIRADGDLNLFVGGTLQNLSGRLSAAQNVDIVAGQYVQKTVLHRYNTAYGQGTRLGQIASVDGQNIRIQSYGDIVVEGGEINGNTIGLRADGNIILKSQQTTYSSNKEYKGFKESASEVEHLTTKLSAKDSIYLMAAGAIELKAAELHADEGVIEILAGQGIFISNEFNQFQKQSSAKWGKTTEEEQEFQTIAIRSALEAGKGVMIASDFGDVTLQATQITSGTGTTIDARNGKVNLLLAKEQDHYFYNRVKKGTWKIKTETIQDTVDTAVYNEIIGGVKVHATHGMTLELGQYEGETLQQTLNKFSGNESLSWMSDLHNDPEFAGNINLVYQKLVEIHKHDKTSSLSPAAMAIVAIAVSVAMGPAGAQLIGTSGSIGAVGFVNGAAMQAGALALATQAATSIANGEGIDGAIKNITSSEGLRSLAVSMATAGVLNSEVFKSSSFFANADLGSRFFSSEWAIDIANQATQAVVTSTVRAGITAAINGTSFGDSFKTSLMQYGVDQLGEYMASEIKGLASEHNWSDAVRYIAHAGAGCIYGAALAEASGSTANGVSCASGAGGAVVGEIIGDAQKKKIEEREQQLSKLLEGEVNLMLANSDFVGLEAEVAKRNYLLDRTPAITEELHRLKAAGVDLAKLGAGLAAFAAGGDVNIASSSGANAAEHNALFLIFIPVVLKLIDTALLVNDFVEVAQVYDDFGPEAGDKALADTLTAMGIGLAISQLIPGSKVFEKALDKLKAVGQDKIADSLYAMAQGRLDGASGSSRKTMEEQIVEAGLDTRRMAKRGEVFYKTTKEATAAAKKLGFEKTNEKVHREVVYFNKKKKLYISRDVGSGDGNGAHNGGVWKMAKSVKELGSRKTRMGTYDADLKWIGD
ncbi:hypothetical protein CWC22_022040 [Pseudoalteromonas rubra]|uniref:DUF637 domain-containing protein n=1 Tax=Pseudoalteromonas rubra TaxID=43658 RepID=A0A5S3UVT3_9GAMM|nr:toxin C-terminal domain-containing protein [Pseudoalteromonas rubra]QPB85691.1 hypothetical protein CWC22_022040 [Pseudoalteromonas rubra]